MSDPVTRTVRERIARAIAEVAFARSAPARRAVLVEETLETYLKYADVALAAVREPTAEMVDAGFWAEQSGAHLNLSGSKTTQNREKIRIRFAAMIAAAAREGR